MAAGSSFFWNDGPLKAGVRAASYRAALMVKGAAEARNPAKRHIRVVGPFRSADGNVQTIRGTGALAHIMEGGRVGGYVIQPGLKTTTKSSAANPFGSVRKGSGKVVRFSHGDGGFAGGPFIGGPMAARPYLGPAAMLYPAFFRQAAPSALAMSGRSASGGLTALLRAA